MENGEELGLNFITDIESVKAALAPCDPFFSDPAEIWERRTLHVRKNLAENIFIGSVNYLCGPWAATRRAACDGRAQRLSVPLRDPAWPFDPFFVYTDHNCGGRSGDPLLTFEFGLGEAGRDVFPLRDRGVCNIHGRRYAIVNKSSRRIAVQIRTDASPDPSNRYPQDNIYEVPGGGEIELPCTVVAQQTFTHLISNASYI